MIDSIKNANEGWRVGHTSNRMSLNFKDPEKLGYILGCLAGDGHISNNVVLSNNDEDVIAYYNKCLKEVFNLEPKTKQGHTCKVTIDNGCLTFSRFLTEVIGFPKKNKSAEIFVPEIVSIKLSIFNIEISIIVISNIIALEVIPVCPDAILGNTLYGLLLTYLWSRVFLDQSHCLIIV